MKKYGSLLVTLALFLAEWFLFSCLVQLDTAGDQPRLLCLGSHCLSQVYSAWLLSHDWIVFILPVGLWISLAIRFQRSLTRQATQGTFPLLQAFIRIVKAEVGTLVGVVNLLFILFNLAWTQDLLLEAIKGDSPFAYPLFTGMFLVVPFIWSRPVLAKQESVSNESRRFLITGLSVPSRDRITKQVVFSEEYPGWCLNWEPIRACLEQYSNIEKVLIVHSERTNTEANSTIIKDIQVNLGNSDVHSFADMVLATTNRPWLKVVEEVIPDQNSFNLFFPELKQLANGYIKMYGYKDDEVLFSIMGGTSLLSAGLTFLSMPGHRGCVYSRQDMSGSKPIEKLEEFEVNIYTIDELWKEITEQVSGD